jgi:hypothetical protein
MDGLAVERPDEVKESWVKGVWISESERNSEWGL